MGFYQKRITAWSWSRLRDWEKCAFFAKCKHVDKLKEPGNAAMDRGSAIGKMCEDYVMGKLPTLPVELSQFGPEFEELREAYKTGANKTIFIEQNWGFAQDWSVVAWDDWAKCWARIKMDLARLVSPTHLLNVDYKTGKCREENVQEYMDQLDLYSLGAFKRFPELELVSSRLAYLDYGTVYPEEAVTIERDMVPAIQKRWEARVKPMLADTVFAKKPNDKCRFCHYRKSNGGPCSY